LPLSSYYFCVDLGRVFAVPLRNVFMAAGDVGRRTRTDFSTFEGESGHIIYGSPKKIEMLIFGPLYKFFDTSMMI
jgi:hypothetical protein